MRRPATLSLWTLFVFLGFPGCGDGPLPPDLPGGPAVDGTVTNNVNGRPVVGAEVRIGDVAVTTGPDGSFRLDSLTPGPATLRCTAPGYVDFETDVTVTSDVLHRQIGLTRIEVFDLGEFALYVPATVDVVGGILLALGGPNTKAFVTGEPFGAPIPEVEASLQALGQAYRELATTRGLAILGTSISAMVDGSESDQILLDAMQAAADTSSRPGLSSAPLLVYGMSGGAPQASGFTERQPDRVAGLFLKVPSGVTTLTSGQPLGVPTFMVLAELDALVDNAALTASFETNRRAGALWALAMEQGVIHFSLTLAQRQLTLAWMNTVLELRLPAGSSGPLNEIAEISGWLGDPSTGDVSTWVAYTGDRASASWLPTLTTAQRWQDFVDIESPTGPGLTYPDVSGIYDLTGVITGSDPAWGIADGTRQITVLTIRHSTHRPRFGGTFDSLRVVDPNGETSLGSPGFVSGSVDMQGRIVVELFFEGSQSAYWYGAGTLASGRMEGGYGAGGHISGTFIAERRPEN